MASTTFVLALKLPCIFPLDFFKKKGVSPMTVKELFEFVTDMSITEENMDEYLDKAMERASSRTLQDLSEQEKIDEEVQLGLKSCLFSVTRPLKVFFSKNVYPQSFSVLPTPNQLKACIF